MNWGDARFCQLRDHFKKFADEKGLGFPDLPDPEPFNATAIETLKRFHLTLNRRGFLLG